MEYLHTQIHYTDTINTNKVKTHFPSQSKAIEIKIFTRLRLGHSKWTHQHLLCGKIAPSCVFCDNSQLSLGHILDECSAFQRNRTTIFGNNKPPDFLKEPLNRNIEYIFKFIFKCNLINQIWNVNLLQHLLSWIFLVISKLKAFVASASA